MKVSIFGKLNYFYSTGQPTLAAVKRRKSEYMKIGQELCLQWNNFIFGFAQLRGETEFTNMTG